MPTNSNVNDTYTVDQSNGANDSDQNLNGFSLAQTGGTQIVWDDQSITSGGNSQSNSSDIFDFGTSSQSDEYAVEQSNNLFDSDKNTNAFVGTQTGFANVGFVDQSIDSGGNTQENNSSIFDDGDSGSLFGGFSSFGNPGGGSHGSSGSGDSYDVTQFNGLRDEDTNGNSVTLNQASQGHLFTDLAFVSQDTTSGGNYQGNFSEIGGTGSSPFSFGGGFGGSGGNGSDDFKIDQSNEMLDNDINVNSSVVNQLGGLNLSFVNQDITSGGNSQENNSYIPDGDSFGSLFSGLGGSFGNPGGGSHGSSGSNDSFDVGQSNEMSDNDGNANQFTLGQAGGINISGVNQSSDSGDNSQSNNSSIFDFGSAFGFGGGSGNDHYTIDQGNLLIDNDINLNIGIVAQVGFGNVAAIDQDISSGDNTQSNNSTIWDTAFNFGGASGNDTYDVQQSNILVDSDTNQNFGSVSQVVGTGNFADLAQGIDAGGNDSGNNSNLFDFGV